MNFCSFLPQLPRKYIGGALEISSLWMRIQLDDVSHLFSYPRRRGGRREKATGRQRSKASDAEQRLARRPSDPRTTRGTMLSAADPRTTPPGGQRGVLARINAPLAKPQAGRRACANVLSRRSYKISEPRALRGQPCKRATSGGSPSPPVCAHLRPRSF